MEVRGLRRAMSLSVDGGGENSDGAASKKLSREISPSLSRTMSRTGSAVRNPSSINLRSTSTRVSAAPDLGEPVEGKDSDGKPAPGTQMSLMALLHMEDGEEDGSGGADDSDEEDNGSDGEAAKEETEHVCCVCMVRHKGAAFTPCGHTFCRLCSRELWVSSGNCPLCNCFMQEILEIF